MIVKTGMDLQEGAVEGVLTQAGYGHFGHSTGFVLLFEWYGVINADVFTSIFSQR